MTSLARWQVGDSDITALGVRINIMSRGLIRNPIIKISCADIEVVGQVISKQILLRPRQRT